MDIVKTLWHNNRGFIAFIVLMMVFRSAVADWNYVPSSSMNPTLVDGDRVIVNKLAYCLRVPFTLDTIVRWDSPHVGDVITFDSPADGLNLIKRVAAVAGDVVSMHDNVLTINGKQIQRTLIDPDRKVPTENGPLDVEVYRENLGPYPISVARIPFANRETDFPPVTVPVGHIMVLGDSRDNSNDSRFIGFIDISRVTGKAERIAMSHNPGEFYLPRAGRWWLPLHM